MTSNLFPHIEEHDQQGQSNALKNKEEGAKINAYNRMTTIIQDMPRRTKTHVM
ncbi:hypothetical protein DPMN_095647 [Dreissena polymorpha]|uniref:Uncharacterized protein n=1 Tax=Dreissena polymorpha TaxID=45954 RepID=A0A9D4R4P6_DREPO|nr:hypothetical protein DPMN_095647 [Dreissena polymorpha]